VKIADFGLARLIMVPQKTLTHEIETLWYRAPEVLLGQKQYTAAVDVWAIGCIFIEMFTRKPFFMGNGYEIEQIFQIFSVLGTPTPKQWPGLDKLPDAKASFPRWKRQSLKELLPQISERGIEVIERMVELNP
jgi:cyclin-dependent kinase